jgi:WD40 repeat protein
MTTPATVPTAPTGCIFLSHSGADTQAARELAEILRRNGLHVWFDKDNLQPGEPWMAALEENIRRASAMLVYVGRLGVQSWVDRELRLGLVRNTQDPNAFRLIPVLGEGAEPSSLPPFLAQHQWADLRNPQNAPQQIERLLQVLATSSEQRAISSQYWTTHSPFRGLQEFKPEDAWLFFGRDGDTQELLFRLGRAPVLAVVGNSGSGKSSLIRAGLLPALKRGRFFYKNQFVESWQIAMLRPSQAPFDYIADVLPGQLAPHLSATEREQLIAHLRMTLPQNPDALRNAIASLKDSNNENVHTLLVVDQFEELFTLIADRNLHAKYVELLMAASRRPGVHLVLSLRADFYSHCLEHKELSQSLEANQYNVPRIEPAQLHETIEKRLALAAARTEAGLIAALLTDVGSEPGDLALLEHALDQLWSTRGPDNTLTNQAYMDMGRLRGALGRHADQVCRQLSSPNEQLLVQRIFLELVQLGEGAQDTRRRVPKNALLRLGPSEHMEQLLDHLASSRLIQTGGEGGENFAEVSHETLIREWPSLRQWLAESREDLRLERRLLASAEEWEKLNRDQGALLQGVRLTRAEDWLQEHPEAGDLLCEFIQASGAARAEAARKERETQERTRRSAIRFRWLSYSLAVFLLAIGALAVIAWREKRNAEVALARSAVQDGIKLFGEGRPDQAAAYFAQALRIAPDSIAATSWLSDLLVNQEWWLPRAILRHPGGIFSAAFSANGRRVVTTSTDGTARVWDVETGKMVGTPLQHQKTVRSAKFNADSRRIVTASFDGTARVWDVETGRAVSASLQHAVVPELVLKMEPGKPLTVQKTVQRPEEVYSAEFSADGRRVVTASEDGTARVWDVETGRPVGMPLQHRKAVESAEFSADGQRVVTASFDETARVWDVETSKPVGTPLQHQGPVWSAAFSPDGRRVVTASYDQTARVWDVETSKPIGAPLQHQGNVWLAAFSPDGKRVVTASDDQTARVWDADTGKPVGAPLQHQATVHSAAFSADGRRVVTASDDQTARVWDADTGKPVGAPLQHQAAVHSAAFSPDGRYVLTASDDGTARLWDMPMSKAAGFLLQHQAAVHSAAFSPDGRYVLTASNDQTAQVWDADTGKPVGAPLQHQGPIISAAFSADGRHVVTTDGAARVWDVETGKPVGAPLRHQWGAVNSVMFSRDGRRVVTASVDGTGQVWDVETSKPVGAPLPSDGFVESAAFSPDGRRVVTASGFTGRVWDVETSKPVGAPLRSDSFVELAAFSPDGRRVVTASQDGTARVWDVATSKPVGAPMQHEGIVKLAAFSLDGRRVVTASTDKTARVWEAETGKPAGAPLQHQGPVNTAAFSPDGRHVVTASDDHTARVWSILLICCTSQEQANRLAGLAEAVSGNEISDKGSLALVDGRGRLQKLVRQSGTGPAPELSLDWIIRRFASVNTRQ